MSVAVFCTSLPVVCLAQFAVGKTIFEHDDDNKFWGLFRYEICKQAGSVKPERYMLELGFNFGFNFGYNFN